MARADQTEGLLRGCPTCGTKVSEAELGLRDYRWVNEYLPGKVGGMDLDFCLTQRATGRGLFLELKPARGIITTGARLTFELLKAKGFDVWAVRDLGHDVTERAILGPNGAPRSWVRMSKFTLGKTIAAWWNRGIS